MQDVVLSEDDFESMEMLPHFLGMVSKAVAKAKK
jgi:hypothetical protein